MSSNGYGAVITVVLAAISAVGTPIAATVVISVLGAFGLPSPADAISNFIDLRAARNSATEYFNDIVSISVYANGDRTASYSSPLMDTGTLGVTWGYVLNFTATPNSNGYGYKFKSVNDCTVTIYKNSLKLYSWCSSCQISFNYATYSLASSGDSITISIGLNFHVYYSINGMPLDTTYNEEHSNTVYMNNGQLP